MELIQKKYFTNFFFQLFFSLKKIHPMSKKNLSLAILLCLGLFYTYSCSNPKVKVDQTGQNKTEQFSTDLPDGEHLVDSSAGIKTYAIVEAKKLKKFRAVTFDGKPSKMGVVNLRAKMQLDGDGDTEQLPCPSHCWRVCLIDIDTGEDAFCNCLCPGPTSSGLFFGMANTESLGPSFGKKRVGEVQTRLMFEIEP